MDEEKIYVTQAAIDDLWRKCQALHEGHIFISEEPKTLAHIDSALQLYIEKIWKKKIEGMQKQKSLMRCPVCIRPFKTKLRYEKHLINKGHGRIDA